LDDLFEILNAKNDQGYSVAKRHLHQIARVFSDVDSTLVNSKPELKLHEDLIDYFMTDLGVGVFTILNMAAPTEVFWEGKYHKVYDLKSLKVQQRALLESFLTLFYFIDYVNESEEMSTCCYSYYKFKGYQKRINFTRMGSNPEIGSKIDFERRKSVQLKELIQSSEYYLKNKSKFNFGNANAKIETWVSLIEKSELHTVRFQNLYGVLSNIAHSEFIGVLHMNGYSEKPMSRLESVKHILMDTSSIISLAIGLIRSRFSYVDVYVKSLNRKDKALLKGYYLLGSGKRLIG
jgi:hypothetical protein